jgi:anti-anti-sigma factor
MTFPSPEFLIRRERGARIHRLIPVGELDIATAPTLEQAFDVAYDEADSGAVVVVDLRELEFIDSSGINALLWMAKRAPDRLRVINGSPAVERLFDVSGVRPFLPIISPDTDPLAPLP